MRNHKPFLYIPVILTPAEPYFHRIVQFQLGFRCTVESYDWKTWNIVVNRRPLKISDKNMENFEVWYF